MSTDEQRVRTEAGWVGVEISKSRVRTPRARGYGLYRLRGPARWWIAGNALRPGPRWLSEEREWTPYAFRLDVIASALRNSVTQGRPDRPMDLAVLRSDLDPGTVFSWNATGIDSGSMVHMRVRWTSAYRGRRTLGGEVPFLLVGEGLPAQPASAGSQTPILYGLPVSTVRSRQRDANAVFQRAHLRRRAFGKARYHAMKLKLGKPAAPDSDGDAPPAR